MTTQEIIYKNIFRYLILFFLGISSAYAAVPVITSAPITTGAKDTLYSYELNATGTGLLTTWSATTGTTLPSWLSLTSATVVSTLAGQVNNNFGSADGNATTASFNQPRGVAVDANGNVYVADTFNNKIRKITSSGVVTTLAGDGNASFADGNGTAASFNNPHGVAVDANGNVYVADTYNNRIRKITSSGVVTTLAGDGNASFADGNGTAASFNNPYGIAVDANGNVYVTDDRIRKITSSGVVTTLAGSGTQGSADGNATTASFYGPSGVAVDTNGNVYVTDIGNCKIRKITSSGIVTTLAGSGAFGSADGNGTAASFNQPEGIAVDTNGNIYVADTLSEKIRKVSSSGVVTTLAGNGTQGSVDGNATVALFSIPTGIAIDTSGNVYVSDSNNNKIRKIAQNHTLSGTPTATNGATKTQDVNLTVDDGNSGLAYQNFTITLSGFNIPTTFSTLSDTNTSDKAAPVTPFSTLTLTDPDSTDFNATITLDSSAKGTLSATAFTGKTLSQLQTALQSLTFTPTQNRVAVGTTESTTLTLTVSADGKDATTTTRVVTTSINDAPTVTSTALTAVTQDSAYLYTLLGNDVDGNVLTWSVTSGTTLPLWLSLGTDGVVTTLAGSGANGSADGNGTATSFYVPAAVAVDTNGNVYVAGMGNNKIRKISSSGVVTTLAGSGTRGSADGNGTATSFNYPQGVAVDTNGNVYVTDTLNNKIRKISSNGVVTTIAGSGTQGSADGNGTAALFYHPTGVAVDANGNVYVSDTYNNKIRKISSSGVVTTIAGSGTATFADGTGSAASFNNPQGIAVDANGNVYVSDTLNNKIRKISSSGVVTSIAGSGTATFADGTGSAASFNNPYGIAVDANGNIYVADTYNHKIRKISSSGVVTTIAGSGTATFADGTGSAASFNLPFGVAVDASGKVYVADTYNNKIRKIALKTKLFGTPTITDVGVHDVNLTLSDGNGGLAYQNFQITVIGIAMTKIAAYATDNTQPAPTVQDYTDAGVTGVNAVNLNKINAEIAATNATGVNTVAKIQALVNRPKIDTLFSDRTILEDAPSFKVDLNVSDIDGDDLNLTVESNNTALIQVTQNYTNLLSQGAYNGVTLDFNLTSQANANGVAQITLSLNDGTAITTKTFDVNVTAVNDAPTLSSISNVIVYMDTAEKNITLDGADVDNTNLTYASDFNKSVISSINFTGNVMQIVPAHVAASTDVNITLSDGDLNTSIGFTFTTIALSGGSDIEQIGNIEQNATTIRIRINSNLTVTAYDNNNSLQYKVKVASDITKANTNLVGALVTLISNGVQTTYDDNVNAVVKVVATVLGEAIDTMTVGTNVTKATFTSPGTQTVIDNNASGKVEIVSTLLRSDGNVTVVAHADGSAQHSVNVGGKVSTFISLLPGMVIVENINGNVESTVGAYDDSNGYFIKAVVTTYRNGTNGVKFIRVNQSNATDISDFKTVSSKIYPLPLGTKIHVYESSTVLYINVELKLDNNFIIQ